MTLRSHIAVAPFSVVYEWEDGHTEIWLTDDPSEAVRLFFLVEAAPLSWPALRQASDHTGAVVLRETKAPEHSFFATDEMWDLMGEHHPNPAHLTVTRTYFEVKNWLGEVFARIYE